MVTDVTGREDFIDSLRRQLLLARAQALGSTRLALGDSSTRVAARIIAGAAKGRGYSLPADIQATDARWVACWLVGGWVGGWEAC